MASLSIKALTAEIKALLSEKNAGYTECQEKKRRVNELPIPLSLMASGAAQHDLPAANQMVENHLFPRSGKLYADKACADAGWAES